MATFKKTEFTGLTSGADLERRGMAILSKADTPGEICSGGAFLSVAEDAYRREGKPSEAQRLVSVRLSYLGSRKIGEALQARPRPLADVIDIIRKPEDKELDEAIKRHPSGR